MKEGRQCGARPLNCALLPLAFLLAAVAATTGGDGTDGGWWTNGEE